jgi:myo-inositol-1(or 4)-monophosphatase
MLLFPSRYTAPDRATIEVLLDLPTTREFAITLARRAGDLIMDILAGGLNQDAIQHKTGFFDIVTEADVASEKLIVAGLREAYPQVPVIAEESSLGMAPDVDWLWVVDPIDGTTNFSHGLPIFGVNIGLVHQGSPVVGVTHDPSNDRTYWAERGKGAWLRNAKGETRLRVSDTDSLERAMLATGFQYARLDPNEVRRTEFVVLDNMTQSVRRLGAASIVSAWVACGYLEAYWETGLKPWDFVPGWVMVEEAGGRVSEHDGSPLRLNSRTMILSNGQPGIHEAVCQTIADIAAGRHNGSGTIPQAEASPTE